MGRSTRILKPNKMKFELLEPHSQKNTLKISIQFVMRNIDMVNAIREELRLQNYSLSKRQAEAVETFLNELKATPERQYIDPCVNCPDCIMLEYGFKKHTKEAIVFFGVLLLAMFGESIINYVL